MHIETLYASTYSPNQPIEGYISVATDAGTIKVNFNSDECRRIQDIAVGAYERQVRAITEELLTKTPALIALPAPPAPDIQDGEFDEIPF